MYFSTVRFCSACCYSSAHAPSDSHQDQSKKPRLPLFCSTHAAISPEETSKHSQVSDRRRSLGFSWKTSLSHSLAPGCLMDILAFKENLSFSQGKPHSACGATKKRPGCVFCASHALAHPHSLTHSLTHLLHGLRKNARRIKTMKLVAKARPHAEQTMKDGFPSLPLMSCVCIYTYIHICYMHMLHAYVTCIYRGP